MPSKIEKIKEQRATEKDQNEANDSSNEAQEVVMDERSDEEYEKEILLLKSSHKVVKNIKDKVNETVIVKTIWEIS